MQLVDWLNDLTVRFLINLPPSELTSVSRICFQIEEAQWYYEDFVRPLEAAAGNHLPHLPLKEFCLLMFRTCPLTSGFTQAQHIAAYDTFLAYKTRIPVRGAIMLDQSMERAVLVKGWKKGASWSFPRGKINKDEKDLHCAVREVYEETGYDIKAAGLVPMNEDDAKYIDVNIREQQVRLFVFSGVPLDTHFEPRTRKEISGIMWYNLRDLPGFSKPKKHVTEDTVTHQSKFYMVAPFLGPLKKWIGSQRRVQSQHMQAGYETAGLETDDAPPPAVADVNARSEELRQLLKIGAAPAQAPPASIDAFAQQHDARAIRELPPQQQVTHGQHMLQLLTGHAQAQPPQHMQRPPPQAAFGSQGFPSNTPGLQGPPGLYGSLQSSVPQYGSQLSPIQQRQPPFWNQMPQHPESMSQELASGVQNKPLSTQAAPQASELPVPKLNAHAMRLLQAFKAPAGADDKSKTQSTATSNTHQARLLDLFKSPTPLATKPVAAVVPPIQSQPAPIRAQETTPKTVTKAPPVEPAQSKSATLPPGPPTVSQPVIQPRVQKEAPKAHAKIPVQNSDHGFVQEMQAFQNRKPTASPHTRQSSHSPANTTRKHKHKTSQEAKIPSFTILPRPGSAKDEVADFAPQILKRPSQDEPTTTATGSNTPQQNHLLALFGKGRTASTATPSTKVEEPLATPTSIQPNQPVTILQHKQPAVQAMPSTPSAPTLAPEKRASSAAQSNLLDLFKKPSAVTSPETPISPFALGSPQAVQHTLPFRSMVSPSRPDMQVERKASNSATPTEAKGFLLGFLNDVVQKEGRTT